MKAGFHINPETGKVGQCTAREQCRFKLSENEHFNTREEAVKASERMLEHKHGALGSMKKTRKKARAKTAFVKAAPQSEQCSRVSAMSDHEVVAFANGSFSNHEALGAVIVERSSIAQAHEGTLLRLSSSKKKVSEKTVARLREDLGEYRTQTAMMAQVYSSSPFFEQSIPAPEESYQQFLRETASV